jgi:uncharacterized protein with ParB-like and HNH nuclease domain
LPSLNNSSLDYDPLIVENLFDASSYYIVPAYQRGYSWSVEEIKELLSDLDDAFRNYPDEEYLLGQIIVCPSITNEVKLESINKLDLIDGQQRCTTLYLFLLRALSRIQTALEDKTLKISRAQDAKVKAWQFCAELFDTSDNPLPRIRAASNGSAYLSLLLDDNSAEKEIKGQAVATFEPKGPTQANMKAAVEEIDSHLEKLSHEEVFSFLHFVMTQVWIVRLGLNTAQHALRVFQKVNNRGLELDDADLIKSYLFQALKSDEDYAELSKHWEDATNKIHSARNKRLKQMENLMKLLIGIRTGLSISKGKLYDTWVDQLNSEEQVFEFANKLPIAASQLVLISQGKIPKDQQKSDLIQGTMDAGWIQPYEVLLAGAHLDTESYKNLLRIVEDRTMLSFWSKEKNNTFEAIIHPWAQAVKELDTYATIEEIREASARALEDFSDLSARAFLGIKSLRYSVQTHRSRMRYVLARVHNAFQGRYSAGSASIESLLKTNSGEGKGFHLDHVFPQAEGKKLDWVQSETKDAELGEASRYSSAIQSIGNLVLLHPKDNISQADALPWDDEKQANLGASELFINRVLNANFVSTKSGPLADELKLLQTKRQVAITQENYSEEKIDSMAQLYWDILLEDIKGHFGIS